MWSTPWCSGDCTTGGQERSDPGNRYLGAAVAEDVPLPDLDLALPAEPPDPDAFAALAETLGLGGAASRLLQALAGRST